MKIKLTARKRALIILLAVFIALVSTLTILYSDMLFRDYENFNLAGSDDSISILFVGNSQVFWGRVPRQLCAISKMYGIEVTYRDISSRGSNAKRLAQTAWDFVQ